MQYLTVAARASPLSRAQVEEFREFFARHYPDIKLAIRYVKTRGDLDKTTSLRALGKSDFFTKEIDQLLLKGYCRLAIHSAKDLPDPLPSELMVAAYCCAQDPRDTLVLAKNKRLIDLPQGAVIATSSEHREASVRQLRSDLTFVDLRGTIEERLAKLEGGEVEGVVVAEAALQRLHLAHLPRLFLTGTTTAGQGKLALVVRRNDRDLQTLIDNLSPITKCL